MCGQRKDRMHQTQLSVSRTRTRVSLHHTGMWHKGGCVCGQGEECSYRYAGIRGAKECIERQQECLEVKRRRMENGEADVVPAIDLPASRSSLLLENPDAW